MGADQTIMCLPALEQKMMQFDNSFSWNGATIAYHRGGNGVPLLLLHGFGEDGSIWQQQAKALQNIADIVIPHLPGSGSSLVSEYQESVMGIDAMADMAAALMDHLGWTAAIVLGHSMGGYITLSLAERHRQKLLAFGLVHSTAYADSEEKKETRRKAIGFIEQNGSAAFLKTAIPGLFGPAFTGAKPDAIASLIQQGETFAPPALMAYYRTMMQRPDRSSILQQSAVPVLFVLGEHDKAAPKADMLQQVSLPALSYMRLLAQSGHMGMLEEPEKLNETLKAFVLAVDGGGSQPA